MDLGSSQPEHVLPVIGHLTGQVAADVCQEPLT